METFWLNDTLITGGKNGGMPEVRCCHHGLIIFSEDLTGRKTHLFFSLQSFSCPLQEVLKDEVERRRSSRLVRFDEPGSRRLTAVASQRASLSLPPMNPASINSSLSKVQTAQEDPPVGGDVAKLERYMAIVAEEKTLVLDDVVVV
jgi:hypothetical protein